MKIFNTQKGTNKSISISLGIFLTLTLLTQYLSYQQYLINKDEIAHEIDLETKAIENRLNIALRNSLSATKTLAFFIEHSGAPENFESIAKDIFESNTHIDAVQLTQQGLITHTYPLEGNEAAIGHNILDDSLTRKEAIKAIEKKELFFAGPFDLIQGGQGVVGRLPIFIDNEFWGFSVVIIRLQTLLNSAGIDIQKGAKFSYQLSKVNPNTLHEEFFLPQSTSLDNDQFAIIEVPDGEMKLYVIANKHPTWIFNVVTLSLLGLLLSLTGGTFAWFLTKQPERLKKLVERKNDQLSTSESNYKTTLERVTDAFIAYDTEWRYTYINKKAAEVLNIDPDKMIGKNIWQEFPELKSLPFYKAYLQAMEEQRYLFIESYLPDKEIWFENHLYPSPDGLSVYFRNITERKKAEKQLLAEKILSESIINSLPGIFYLYDESGKFMRWNKNFETVSGYTADEVSTMHPLDFYDETEKNLLKNKIENVFTTGMDEVDAHFLTKEGKKIPYYFNGWKVIFEGKSCLIGVGLDITERKKGEEALFKKTRDLKERIKELNCLYQISEIVNNPGYSIGDILQVCVNAIPSAYQYPEMTCACIKLGSRAFFTEEFKRTPWKQEAVLSIQEKHVGNIEVYYMVEKPEEHEGPFLIEERGLINSASKIISSAIEKKQAEETIRVSERKLRFTLDTMLEGVQIVNADWKFVYVNDSAVAHNRYTREELIGYTMMEKYPGIEKTEMFKTLEICMLQRKAQQIENRFVFPDGNVGWFLLGVQPMPEGIFILSVDITERKKAEDEIIRSQKELRELTSHLQTVREEERSGIAREIHDELGQQLTGLKMDTAWLSKKVKPEDTIIRSKLNTMLLLVDETIKTVRKISSELRPGILDDFGLVAALEAYGSEFATRSGIKCTFHSSLPDIDLDKKLALNIYRIYQEALTNTARHAHATAVESYIEKDDIGIKLIIKDNGEGFDLNESASKNTLGLLGMKERALMFNGDLKIKTTKKTGTKVILKIPLTHS